MGTRKGPDGEGPAHTPPLESPWGPEEELEFPLWSTAQELAFAMGCEVRRKAGKKALILGRDAQCGPKGTTLTRT